MTPVTSPIAVAVSTSALTDSREDTSTVAVLTSKPASLSTFAAASAFSLRRSASKTCLPALTRRAIAWPIDPAPMTTMTLVMAVSILAIGSRRCPCINFNKGVFWHRRHLAFALDAIHSPSGRVCDSDVQATS